MTRKKGILQKKGIGENMVPYIYTHHDLSPLNLCVNNALRMLLQWTNIVAQ